MWLLVILLTVSLLCLLICRKVILDSVAPQRQRILLDIQQPTQARRGKTVWERDDSSHQQRAKEYGVPWEDVSVPEVFIADGWMCQLCGKPIDPGSRYPDPMMPSIDHIVPLSQPDSPGHVRSNVQASHLRCNLRKGNRV